MVKSLLEGFRNRDHIRDLNARLEEFPDTLHGLYSHMLDPIRQQPRYFKEASRYFQYMLSITQDCKVIYLSMLLITLAEWEYDSKTYNETRKEITYEQVLSRCADTSTRIKSRCAGLLEVSPGLRDAHHLEPGSEWDRAYHHLKVSFLHQTVVDYINDTQLKVDITIVNPTFSANEFLLRSFVTQLKIYQNSVDVTLALRYVMDLERIEEQRSEVTLAPLLDECDTICSAIHLSPTQTVESHRTRESTLRNRETADSPNAFLNFAISRGLLLYAQSKLGSPPFTFNAGNGVPLLHYAVDMEDEESFQMCVAG